MPRPPIDPTLIDEQGYMRVYADDLKQMERRLDAAVELLRELGEDVCVETLSLVDECEQCLPCRSRRWLEGKQDDS